MHSSYSPVIWYNFLKFIFHSCASSVLWWLPFQKFKSVQTFRLMHPLSSLVGYPLFKFGCFALVLNYSSEGKSFAHIIISVSEARTFLFAPLRRWHHGVGKFLAVAFQLRSCASYAATTALPTLRQSLALWYRSFPWSPYYQYSPWTSQPSIWRKRSFSSYLSWCFEHLANNFRSPL